MRTDSKCEKLNNFKRSFVIYSKLNFMSGENNIIQNLTRSAEINKTRNILSKFEFGLII